MKKFLSLLLIVCLYAVSVSSVMAVGSDLLIGDVDLDGRISVKDATLIQKYAASLESLSVSQLVIADVDISDNVNVKDATMIQKYVAGIIDEFPSKNEEGKEEPNTSKPTEPISPHSYEYLVEWVKENGTYNGKNISYIIQERNGDKYTLSYSPEYDNMFVDCYMNPTTSTESYAMLRLDNYFYGLSFYGDSIFGYVNAPIYSQSQSLTYSKCECNTFTPDKMLPLAKSSVDLLLETLRYCLLINEIPVTLADLGFLSY